MSTGVEGASRSPPQVLKKPQPTIGEEVRKSVSLITSY